jgi:UDP-N-acetylmuramoyl-L-alanyl-D-glutamate--2,6-diaminopimelate ligase
VTLDRLCAPWPELQLAGHTEVTVTRVVADSREAGPGSLFVAVADGHTHVRAALAAGTSVVAVDAQRLPEVRAALLDREPTAWVVAPSTRGLPARLARECEGRPDQHLVAAGVTGTNGKTTVSFLLRELLGRVVGPCGLLGTIRYDDGRAPTPAPLTTPGGPLLYQWLGRMAANGCRAVALEVSSHALDQDRTADLALDVAILTNLGRDHLDYHGDLGAYLAAKSRIMDLVVDGPRRGKPAGALVVNAADAAFASLDTRRLAVVRFAAAAGVAADLRVTAARLGLDGLDLEFDFRGRPLALASPLVGRFNVENLTAALAAGLALGLDAEACVDALAGVDQVPGRLERLRLPAGGLAVVDYAHTHDALAAVLAACRELTDGLLLVVFGCGGDRDRGKRPLMGAVAATHADRAWITSDNPRSEEPTAICAEIVAGFDCAPAPRAREREVIVDRRTAITAALAAAGPRDIVVIAGKGHEDYQLVAAQRLHLDDREIVRDWIAHA